MKLLLTSAGLANRVIIDALEKLLGSSAQGVKLAFVPTAANVEAGDKSWLIKDLNTCVNAGFEVDIVDISAVPKTIWLPRLEAATVLLFGGGNTFHLMRWMTESGLQSELPRLLQSRIYVGISAGSCVAGPTIYNSVQNLFDEHHDLEIQNGLDLVSSQIVPHLNSPFFTKIRTENLARAAQSIVEPVYVLDDASALVVDGDDLAVASTGEWHVFNELHNEEAQ